MPAARANMPGCWPSARYHAARGETAAQHLPHPLLRARHQSGLRRDGRHAGRGGRLRRARQHRHRRPHGKAEQHAAHLAALMITYPSTHGVFEEGDPRHLRHRPRPRRAGLSRRRQPQRAGRAGAAGRLGADVCHSICTRPSASRMAAAGRAWGRSASRRIWRRSCPAIRRPNGGEPRPVGPVSAAPFGLGVDPADLLGLYPHDGRRRADAGDRGGHPQRQLHRAAARAALSRCCYTGRRRPRGA